jgi:hypothetical protein
MSAEGIIAIIALCVIVIAMFVGNTFWLLMMEEVDHRKPDLDVYSFFSSFSRRWDRSLEISRKYRSLRPNGKLHIYERACLGIAIVGMITLVLLGLIHLASPRIE